LPTSFYLLHDRILPACLFELATQTSPALEHSKLAIKPVNPNEILFLGVVPSAPDSFPLVIGLGFPESKSINTVFIKPPDEWGILQEADYEDTNKPQKDKIKNRVVEGILVRDLITKGIEPNQASEQILEGIKGRRIYSVNPKQDSYLLGKMGNINHSKLKLHSAIVLFDELVPPERERKLQLKTKTNIAFYPRNKSDVRWLIELYFQCRLFSKST
jgi:hypothetical protein